MGWLSILTAAFGLLAEIIKYASSRQAKTADTLTAVREAVKTAKAEVANAKAVEDHVRGRLAAEPRGLRDDDGFRR